MTIETWRDIPGHDHYQASDQGRIRSLDHVIEDSLGRRRRIRGRVLRPGTTQGRRYVMLRKAGPTYFVARLVALAHHGQPDGALYARHRNGDITDDTAANVYWSEVSR